MLSAFVIVVSNSVRKGGLPIFGIKNDATIIQKIDDATVNMV